MDAANVSWKPKKEPSIAINATKEAKWLDESEMIKSKQSMNEAEENESHTARRKHSNEDQCESMEDAPE